MSSTPPATPLGHKRRRIQSSTAPVPPFDATGLISMDDVTTSSSSHSDPLVPLLLSSPERLQQSMSVLEAGSHKLRLQISAQEQSDKGTEPAYNRHYNNYMRWWASDQAARKAENPMWKEVPPLPITATYASQQNSQQQLLQ